jgi:cobalamin biosynthesis Mg chelatase CobN
MGLNSIDFLSLVSKYPASNSKVEILRFARSGGGQVARVLEFVDPVRAVAHRGAGVDQQSEPGVGLAAVALEIAPFGPREDVPVDVTKVVALAVGAVLGEFLAESEIGRAMQAGESRLESQEGSSKRSRLARAAVAILIMALVVALMGPVWFIETG